MEKVQEETEGRAIGLVMKFQPPYCTARKGGGIMRNVVFVLLWILTILSVTPALAAAPAAEPPVLAPPAMETAPVVIDGMFLFNVVGIRAFPSEDRAERITARIKSIASDRRIPTSNIKVVETEQSTNIVVDGRIIMSVLDLDAAAEGVRRQILAEAYLSRIQQAIENYRSDRNPENIIREALYALGATIIFILALILFRFLYRKSHSFIESRLKVKIHAVRIKSFEIIQAETLWLTLINVLRAVRLLLILVLSYIYLYTVLALFPWTRNLATNLLQYVITPLKQIGGAILGYVPSLIFILILLGVTRYVLKFVKLFFLSVERGTLELGRFDREWARPTYKIVRLLIIVFVAVIIYPYIPGSQTDAFKGISIFIGIIFSLGSTAAIGNIIAGYMLTYRRAFKIGDRVQIGEIVGDVAEIRVQVTHVRTPKNEEITIPNSVILGSSVINYSSLAKEKGLILHTMVTIGYDTPWRQVDAMLLMAAARTEGVLKEPAPFVLHKSLDDFYIRYELNAYTDDPQRMVRTYSELHQHIVDAFNEYGVQITSPNYENDPEGGVKVVPKERWYEAPAKPPESEGVADTGGVQT
jgi:small-conductance mechanosensitive channel